MLDSIQKNPAYPLAKSAYRATRLAFARAKRGLLDTNGRIVSAYKPGDGLRKLHIGSGDHLLPGYINSDLDPLNPAIFRMDATKRFPFPDGSLDRIYSEHMIEHIAFEQGQRMLSECHRTLKTGGRIRISTPDLKFLAELQDAKDGVRKEYVEWSNATFLGKKSSSDPSFAINNFFRDWGHQFIYSETTLRDSLEKAGFGNISKFKVGESDDPCFGGLENTGRMPDGFLQLETMTLEAEKL